ncbi:MAG TPA: ATP-binding protein, partial [Niabella sp.]|nr:ATP-binding protein [Niabella sp.]
GGGLVQFDSKKKLVVKRYTTGQGLSNNSIFSTLRDDHGRLWLGTFNGLSQFNVKSKKFKNYYRGDGLESDQFHFNAACKLRSGAFVFGGIKGYNIFYPDSIGVSAGNAPLRFTGILIDGKPIEQSPDFISIINGSSINAIAVPYKNAVFSFNFAALEYAVPAKISYAYLMEGWDKGWNYTGNIHAATYTHLNEGRYIFKVKSTNGEGVWSNEIAIPLIVYPPWYRSWWAYLIYGLILSFLVYLYISYRMRQGKLKYEVNLQKVEVQREKAEREKREIELALEKAEHEKYATELAMERTQRALEHSEREAEKAIANKEREINERRASFFTSISHEFRTPLSLIINPIKDMLAKRNLLPDNKDQELDIVYRNARRMLSLTNQLLLFRREESGLDKVYPSKLDLVSVSHEVFLCFTQQAAAKDVDYQFHCPEESIEFYADRDKLEIIIFNLLSNALKYVQQSGKVSLSIINDSNEVTIRVADDGPGIAPEAGDQLFEKFYQGRDTNREIKVGFGIGLYLVKQFVEAHHGTVMCTDTLGGGATFILKLLKGSDHFSEFQLSNIKPSVQSVLEEISPEAIAVEKSQLLVAEVVSNTTHLVASERQVILVVDDDASIRQYLKLAFADSYQVYEAADGREGIQVAEK